MRKWELIKQSQLLKIKSQILLNLFNEKYELRLGEFNNTTGTERVKILFQGPGKFLEKHMNSLYFWNFVIISQLDR